jgi:hypothetical protein
LLKKRAELVELWPISSVPAAVPYIALLIAKPCCKVERLPTGERKPKIPPTSDRIPASAPADDFMNAHKWERGVREALQ